MSSRESLCWRTYIRSRDGNLEVACWLCPCFSWYAKIGNLRNHLRLVHKLDLSDTENPVAMAQTPTTLHNPTPSLLSAHCPNFLTMDPLDVQGDGAENFLSTQHGQFTMNAQNGLSFPTATTPYNATQYPGAVNNAMAFSMLPSNNGNAPTPGSSNPGNNTGNNTGNTQSWGYNSANFGQHH
ncbi:hypothetical protein M434DRAFT_26803 [Hypoxylon sp. CO27-5]|nr:hypothetical protein M434DRAFT_26803 [Hypoxylon sp. CO27-5]